MPKRWKGEAYLPNKEERLQFVTIVRPAMAYLSTDIGIFLWGNFVNISATNFHVF